MYPDSLSWLAYSFGVVNGVQVFTPFLVNQENPSFIINTGSKQGQHRPTTALSCISTLTVICSPSLSIRSDRSSRECGVQRVQGQSAMRQGVQVVDQEDAS
jgi:hypothetical protein